MIDRVHLLRSLGAKLQARIQRPPRARALPFLKVIRLVARQQREHLVQTRHVPPLPSPRALRVDPHARLGRAFPHGALASLSPRAVVARARASSPSPLRARCPPRADTRVRAIVVVVSFASARARFDSRGRMTRATARAVRPSTAASTRARRGDSKRGLAARSRANEEER